MPGLATRQACQLLAAAWLAAPPAAAQPGPSDWCEAPRRIHTERLPLTRGLPGWRIEAQDPRTRVQADNGVLAWQAPAGLSIWWLQPLAGHWRLSFTATPQPAPPEAGPLAGRVSDLNLFWNASENDGSAPRTRDGAFASYDTLQAWYVGFGANGNTTTRLRQYGGSPQTRNLLNGWADAPEATPQDRQGAMTAATRLRPGEPVHVLVESHPQARPGQPHMRWWAGGRLLFERREPPHRVAGHFGLRSTTSAFHITDVEIQQCLKP